MDTFTLVGSIAIVVVGLTTHEAAHAWTANRLGDPTARLMGRLTLNPLPHIDLVLTVLLPIMLMLTTGMAFGGAKPVPVQVHRFRNPMKGMALVAIAGPASNLLQAIFWSGVMSFFLHFGIWEYSAQGINILVVGVVFNIVLMVFNLVPIPPLDGSRVVFYFLGTEARKVYGRFERFGILIVFALIFLARDTFWTVLYAVIRPVVKFVFWVTALPEAEQLLHQIF
ncbi:MAG: site-2 protease family protein [Planctomycetota bacterium]